MLRPEHSHTPLRIPNTYVATLAWHGVLLFEKPHRPKKLPESPNRTRTYRNGAVSDRTTEDIGQCYGIEILWYDN
jgi:hypothetical protein